MIVRLTVCSLGEIPDHERPLELGDIMPLDKKSYDKMRPPKFKGKSLVFCPLKVASGLLKTC